MSFILNPNIVQVSPNRSRGNAVAFARSDVRITAGPCFFSVFLQLKKNWLKLNCWIIIFCWSFVSSVDASRILLVLFSIFIATVVHSSIRGELERFFFCKKG